jgi:predicted amidohydrolase YtcJ
VRWIIVLFATLSTVCSRGATVPTARSELAPAGPLVLVNAKIFTADPAHPYAEALAVEDGRFTAIGTTAEVRRLVSPAIPIVDVGGRLVTPGLIEAHAHFDMPLPGRPITPPDFPYPGPDSNQTLASVAKAARVAPGWIWGMTDAVFNDPRNWRHALDVVAPNNPVMLTGFSFHAMLLNSRALEALGIADGIADPIGGHWGRDASGGLNGRADEAAVTIVSRRAWPADPEGSLEAKTLRQGAAAYARWGVTTVHHMADELPLASVRAALERANLPIKWTVYAWALPQVAIADAWREVDTDRGVWPPRTRLGGLKWILDGSPLERGAFLLEDYTDRPGWRGRSNYSGTQLREILSGALTSRYQVALHTVGDAEADMLIRIMGELAPATRWRSVRVRIEHGDGIFGERLTRVARLGAVIDQQPIHAKGLKVEGGQLIQDARLGVRADQFTPLRGLLAAGIPLALSSDSNNVDETASPFLNIMIAVSYPRRPDQTITREQALTAYTAGGAYAEREEAHKGRIIRGMAADLAVLSQDILTAPLEALPSTSSLLTIVDGAIVYAEGPFAALGATLP